MAKEIRTTTLFLALLAAVRPAASSSSSPSAGTSPEPVLTFCSGQPRDSDSSSPAVTSGELAGFLDALCAGAYGAGAAHMSSPVAAGTNRTMYGVAQCRPDVPVPDCAACLAAASSRLVAAGRTACAAWHDACFLRYSDRDPHGSFREDEYTATTVVFNATHAPLPYRRGRAAVRRLLVAAGSGTTSSHMCRGAGASRTAAAGGLMMYGLTRCAAGTSCDGCRRCLRGALAAVERGYNGSAGMQVLRLSCMARYESYPFYNARYKHIIGVTINNITSNMTLVYPPAAQPTPAPPAGHTRPRLRPPAAHPPLAPPAGHPPRPPAAAPPVETHLMQQSHGKKSQKTLIMLILPIATGIVVITVILVHIWYRRRKQSIKKRHVVVGIPGDNIYDQEDGQWSMEEEEKDGEKTSCQLYSYQVLEAATCHFSNRNKLGSGGFGTVYKGILENGTEVAVKRLRDSKRNLQELEREVSIVATLCHKNLVRFLGYCFQDEGKFLVYEYVPNNSLDKFWYKACSQSQKLEWATWFNIILGVARGLRFLHDKGIIHRDLKPHNVLLDENFNPKIADFDLMRVYDKQRTHESTEKVAGTFGYIAPECTSGRKFLLSIKSDVYSYGVLVLEVITGHKIYTFEGQKSEGLVEYVWQHWKEKRAGDIVDGDLGVEGQEVAARQALRCVHVALLCVQSDRSRRPTMGQVIAMLTSEDDDDGMELPEPSLPGYLIIHPRAASGSVRLPCLGCR